MAALQAARRSLRLPAFERTIDRRIGRLGSTQPPLRFDRVECEAGSLPAAFRRQPPTHRCARRAEALLGPVVQAVVRDGRTRRAPPPVPEASLRSGPGCLPVKLRAFSRGERRRVRGSSTSRAWARQRSARSLQLRPSIGRRERRGSEGAPPLPDGQSTSSCALHDWAKECLKAGLEVRVPADSTVIGQAVEASPSHKRLVVTLPNPRPRCFGRPCKDLSPMALFLWFLGIAC